jgi:hypothetical protein
MLYNDRPVLSIAWQATILQHATIFWAKGLWGALLSCAAVHGGCSAQLQLIDDVHFFIESFASNRDGMQFITTGLQVGSARHH